MIFRIEAPVWSNIAHSTVQDTRFIDVITRFERVAILEAADFAKFNFIPTLRVSAWHAKHLDKSGFDKIV